jgi:uncharacterized protein DUF1573
LVVLLQARIVNSFGNKPNWNCVPESEMTLRWAILKYQNKGDKPIAIKNVSTSCGCTAATAKNSAEPGEKGEVTATFKIGDRTGAQQKMVFT